MVGNFISLKVSNNEQDRINKLGKSFAKSDIAGAMSGGWKINRKEIYAQNMGTRYAKR